MNQLAMGWKDTAEPVLTRFPTVERPEGHVPFNKKLMWTAGMLFMYFFLTNIILFGLAEGRGGSDLFGRFRSILAGAQGSILQVGIGPIVTGSIVLQLLDGGDLLNLDTNNDPRDQALYQGLQKLLVVVMTIVTAMPMVFTGFLPASPRISQMLGIGIFGVQLLMLAQIVAGGILILYMDEIVSKWGIGSGVGLFIIAGIAQSITGGIVEIFRGWYTIATNGLGVSLFTADGLQALLLGQGSVIAILTTVIIFVTVVYAESTRIEIPLSHAKVKGGRGRFPIKLIYASVLPMILVRALQANIQFIGRILNMQLGDAMPAWLGVYADGQPVAGFFYYLAPIQSPQQWMWWLASASGEPWQILIRLTIDMTIMVIGGAIFAVFWVETTGMSSDAVAEQIQSSGMQIPGFRRNPQITEKVVARYIPAVTMLGGAIVGFLAVSANLLGTIGAVSGTGLLLSVSITYRFYEQMAQEKMMEMHPMLREMFD